jgi:hypothetical protein
MKAPEVKQEDLITMLKKPVEHKAEGAAASAASNFDIFDQKGPQPNPDDFDLPKREEVQESAPPDPDAPRPSKKPRLTDKEYEEEAVMAIEFFDSINVLALPWLYQKTIFTAKERELLKVIQEKYKNKETVLEENEQKLMEKYLAVQDAIKEVPLADTEKDMILMPLHKVFKKYNIQLSCEFMLLTALAMVYGPRYAPMFNRLENLDKK